MAARSFLSILVVLSLIVNHALAQDSTPNGPTQPNINKSCNAFHTVVSGDGCWSIEQKYSISHSDFLLWNPDVSSDCITNFWPGYAYCVGLGPTGPTQPNIAKNCVAWHTVASGDGCWSIEQAYGISHANFIAWNPDVSDDCITNFWPGYSYCVKVGAQVSTTSKASSTTSRASSSSLTTTRLTSTTRATSGSVSLSTTRPTANGTYSIRVPIVTYNLTSTAIESAFPPKRTQSGQPSYCNNWQYVEVGNTCESIVGANSWLTENEFLDWNPSLGDDCSGLYVGWWVCIGVQRQSITASFEYITGTPNVTVPGPTAFVPTTYPTANSSFVASPTQTGIPSNCQAFYLAKKDDTCQAVLKDGAITDTQFYAWNPALAGNCQGMWEGYYYCIAAYSTGTLPMPPVETTKPRSLLPANQITTCNRWYKRRDGDTCDEIVAMFGTFSKANFVTWNPSVGTSCTNLVDLTFYCVSIPGTPTTRTSAVSTTSGPTQTPMQSGIAANCKDYWLVSSSDTCDSIVADASITLAQLLSWNPALGSSTCTGLVPNYYVCIRVGESTSTPNITTPPTSSTSRPSSSVATTTSRTTSAAATITTPTPHQDGMVAGCRRFYLAQDGDGCWAIANSAGIALSDFYAWNPAVGQCEGLWLNTWYCIGIAGPVTTISSGPPVPT